jgi:DNA-binding transcriptional LysR family regulator
MKDVGIAELNAFAEVAMRRSFARAAAQLGVSRSRLSETVRSMEERLGVRLLNRTTRSVAPTEAGERLLARLRPVLDDLSAALDSVNDFRDTPAGLLRLTVPPPAARSIVEPVLTRFLAEHPAIRLEVSVDGTLTDIVSERFDAGIRFGERIDRDMIALRILHETRPLLAAAPAYLARHGRPTQPQDLQAHNCIRTRFPSGALEAWRFEKGGKMLEVAVGGSLILNDAELLLRAAVDGVGLVYAISEFLAAPVADGRLVRLLEDWMPRPANFFLYYPTRRQVPATLQALIDFLRRERVIAASPRPKRGDAPTAPRVQSRSAPS